MSIIVTHLATALGGVLAGLALAGPLLHRQRMLAARARRDALRDELTGLPNRRALAEHLRRAVYGAEPFGVILLDLDHFKAINDGFGHDSGDQLLSAVAGGLHLLPAPVSMAARLGGDEFVLVAHGGPHEVRAAAHAAWQAVACTRVNLRGYPVTAAASVGYTLARPGLSARQLLHEADQAMYQAKKTGTAIVAHQPHPHRHPIAERPGIRLRDARRFDDVP